MIGRAFDAIISAFSPSAGLQRVRAREAIKRYKGAEQNRLTNHSKPKNQSADTENAGPFGADGLRAWARMLVRDNAYARGVVDTILASVVGNGITAESVYDNEEMEADDVDNLNDERDRIWQRWSEVCDVTGQYSFEELQEIAYREVVEAGECLVHIVPVPRKYKGILRPVPLALEIIEADRLALDWDTYMTTRDGELRIVRGVELDEDGTPVAYWIYPDHPTAPHSFKRTPQRIPAKNILHLFRRDRVGQSRGVTWFAPVLSWLRDLGVYVDNELQASAVASCFTVAVKSATPSAGLVPPTTGDPTTDSVGNQYEYLEPGLVMNLGLNDSIESANPGRPNSAATPWIRLMLQAIAVGTGLSYETVARDYSQTNYSSNRASQLEDRRRFRRWQKYIIDHLCQPVWDRFCEAAALAGNPAFPPMNELLDDRRQCSAVTWQPPVWEWVDPTADQQTAENSIRAFQSTYQDELSAKNGNYRRVFKQRAKEKRLLKKLGLVDAEQVQDKESAAEIVKAVAAVLAAQNQTDDGTTKAIETELAGTA